MGKRVAGGGSEKWSGRSTTKGWGKERGIGDNDRIRGRRERRWKERVKEGNKGVSGWAVCTSGNGE